MLYSFLIRGTLDVNISYHNSSNKFLTVQFLMQHSSVDLIMKKHNCVIKNYKSSYQGYVELCVSGLLFPMDYLIS